MTAKPHHRLEAKEREDLLQTLEDRFESHMERHPDLRWDEVRRRLDASPGQLVSLYAMERTGGEPDVFGRDPGTGAYRFVDCAPESPKGRRSVCYDRAARESRKKHKPESSAVELAEGMGAALLTPDEYQALQDMGPFDTKTSSWLWTPQEVRKLGGAIFGDHRFGRTWLYHNGAESYYAARGFRCGITI